MTTQPPLPYEQMLVLASCWLGGLEDEQILVSYPNRTQEELDAVKAFLEAHWNEFEAYMVNVATPVTVVFDPSGMVIVDKSS